MESTEDGQGGNTAKPGEKKGGTNAQEQGVSA
jgi:hypothetical protein